MRGGPCAEPSGRECPLSGLRFGLTVVWLCFVPCAAADKLQRPRLTSAQWLVVGYLYTERVREREIEKERERERAHP